MTTTYAPRQINLDSVVANDPDLALVVARANDILDFLARHPGDATDMCMALSLIIGFIAADDRMEVVHVLNATQKSVATGFVIRRTTP